jgi:uroporphyrinogen III methyltransferase / synthase
MSGEGLGTLAGRCIVITRPRAQAATWVRQLRRLGASPLLCPTIAVVPPADWQPLDDALVRLPQFDWLVFTSTNGVRFFCQRLGQCGLELRALRCLRLAAVGPRTAQTLRRRGLRVDFVPSTYQAEGLLAGFKRRRMQGKRVLLPRAARGREVLVSTLQALQADVTAVAVYQTVLPKTGVESLRQHLQHRTVDMVTFTSSSAVENLHAMLGHQDWPALLSEVAVACIGAVTASTARAHGLQVAIVPVAATIAGLTAAIVDYYGANGPVSVQPVALSS